MTQKWTVPYIVGNLSIPTFSLAIAILLISISQSFALEAFVDYNPAKKMTVHADKTSYNQGDVVKISGIVTGISTSHLYQEPAGKVELLLSYNNNEVFKKILVDVQSNGIYSYQFNATQPGIYQMFVKYQYATAKGTFKVGSQSSETFIASTISIQTDKSSYVLGEQVKISGKVTGIVPGLQVSLVLVNEGLNQSYKTVFTNLSSDDSYSYQYVPQERGKIHVVVSYNHVPVSIAYIVK